VLEAFLNTKPLYYDVIDYTRMPRVYESIKAKLKLPKIIHLIGTNGKGTTGRFLASALYSLGYKTGHYTSPHIREFNERIWLNGSNISSIDLNKAHLKLLTLLSKEDSDMLSYFEYTTLLAVFVYEDMDYVVLEAGLGGEYDATAVFPNILTLVTPIDIDHEAFLGNSIEKIARTKLNAIVSYGILAKQPHKESLDVAQDIAVEKKIEITTLDSFISAVDSEKIKKIARFNNLPKYLEDNLSLAIAALNFLDIPYSSENFDSSRLYGRLSKISDNIIIDVGHNTLAAKSIYESLKNQKFTLVYNSYKDKNYREILTILKPIIKEVLLIEVNDTRIELRDTMQKTLDELSLKHGIFEGVLASQNYLVFGSFIVVEAFLKGWNE